MKKNKEVRIAMCGRTHGRILLQTIQISEALKQYPHLKKVIFFVNSQEQQDKIDELEKKLKELQVTP